MVFVVFVVFAVFAVRRPVTVACVEVIGSPFPRPPLGTSWEGAGCLVGVPTSSRMRLG